jgi:hypothetical protein
VQALLSKNKPDFVYLVTSTYKNRCFRILGHILNGMSWQRTGKKFNAVGLLSAAGRKISYNGYRSSADGAERGRK